MSRGSILGGREHQDSGVWKRRPNPAERFDAVHAIHAHVEERHVRSMLSEELAGRRAVIRLGHDVEPVAE